MKDGGSATTRRLSIALIAGAAALLAGATVVYESPAAVLLAIVLGAAGVLGLVAGEIRRGRY